jgi:hypothetical protein
MGKRNTDRLKLVLPVRLWGMDTTGKPFHQMAHTLNVNHSGARLGGVRVLMPIDEIVGVQYKHKKARFKVVWLGKPGTKSEEQIGITRIQGEPEIWPMELPVAVIRDEYEAPPPKKSELDKRDVRRYACSGGIEIRQRHAKGPGVWAALTDISMGGCFSQMASPFPKDTNIDFAIRIGTVEIRGVGAIRSSLQGVGMGVDFLTLPAPDKERLEYLIEKFSKGDISPEEAPFASDEVSRRLQAATSELRVIEYMMRSADMDSLVLREFRSALGHVRHTAWALQQWVDVQSKRNDPFPVLAYLNTERIRLATHLCKNMSGDIDSLQLRFEKHEVEGLLSAVEDLFLRLSGLNFSVEIEDVRAKAAAAAAGSALITSNDDDEREPIRGIAVESELELVNPIGEPDGEDPEEAQTSDASLTEERPEPARGIPPGNVDTSPQRRIG